MPYVSNTFARLALNEDDDGLYVISWRKSGDDTEGFEVKPGRVNCNALRNIIASFDTQELASQQIELLARFKQFVEGFVYRVVSKGDLRRLEPVMRYKDGSWFAA